MAYSHGSGGNFLNHYQKLSQKQKIHLRRGGTIRLVKNVRPTHHLKTRSNTARVFGHNNKPLIAAALLGTALDVHHTIKQRKAYKAGNKKAVPLRKRLRSARKARKAFKAKRRRG